MISETDLTPDVSPSTSGVRRSFGKSLDITPILAIIGIEARKGLLKNFMLTKIANFLREVSLEARKINWPQRSQIFRYTLIVLGISLAVALFLGGLDLIFITILDRFIL